ncbi:MAG: ribonuclease M5 [Ureaplasma sp.]|nr:ribonuclease M5 [Ureaplasma sp.]
MNSNKNKIFIDGVIVVEGNTDKSRLNKLLDNPQIITTNGSDLNQQTLSLIKNISKSKKIILFLDPDYMGEKIRKKIADVLENNYYHCFVKKTDMKKDAVKIGIAEATDEAILEALKNMIAFNKTDNSLTLQEYNSLNLNSVKKRLFICDYYKISYCNNKQLFKRLNMMNLSIDNLKEVMDKYVD